MAYINIGFVKVPKYFYNYYLDTDYPVYKGWMGNDSNLYNYRLQGVGWVIANTYFPFTVTFDNYNYQIQYRDINGYCYYKYGNRYIYKSNILYGGRDCVQVTSPAYIGSSPMEYTYTDNGVSKTGGDDFYLISSVNQIYIGNNTFSPRGKNKDSGTDKTLTLQLGACYLKSDSNSTSRFGVYTHNTNGNTKTVGCPRWQGFNNGYYVRSVSKGGNYNKFSYKHSSDTSLNIQYDGEKWTIQNGRWNLSGQPTPNNPIYITGQTNHTFQFVDYVAGDQMYQAYSAEVAKCI